MQINLPQRKRKKIYVGNMSTTAVSLKAALVKYSDSYIACPDDSEVCWEDKNKLLQVKCNDFFGAVETKGVCISIIFI